MSVIQGDAEGTALTVWYPGCLSLTSPIINMVLGSFNKTEYLCSVLPWRSPLYSPTFTPLPQEPGEQPGDPWPVGSALPEMPHGSGDLLTTVTCIRNQSTARCLACWVNSPEPELLTNRLTVGQRERGGFSWRHRIDQPCHCSSEWPRAAVFVFLLHDDAGLGLFNGLSPGFL